MAERKFTDLELERAIVEDLPGRRAAELERDATEADRARLAELRTEHQTFLQATDVDAEVAAIQRLVARATPERPKPFAWMRWLVPAGALAAAAAVMLIITRRTSVPVDDDFQTKGGGITLIVHVATGSQSRQLHTGETVQPGAHIRFEVNASHRGYVAVVGVDGEGGTTIYYPYGGSAPVELDPLAGGLLPGAIALDASQGDERFYAIYALQPFALDTVVPAIRGGIALPPGVSSAEVLLHKRSL